MQAGVEAGKGLDSLAVFTRAERGWAEGLHLFDRFVKNTYEVLSPLNELTAQMLLTQHRFLTPDYTVQHTVFGEGPNRVEVTVNMSSQDYHCRAKIGGEVNLPSKGFLIESPTFAAFYARTWNGVAYDSAPLFTLRSLDGKELSSSRQIRVYHGFGDARLKWRGRVGTVEKETTL
jgi:hypothetical protein